MRKLTLKFEMTEIWKKLLTKLWKTYKYRDLWKMIDDKDIKI